MTPSAPASSAWLIAIGLFSAVRTSTGACRLAAPTACSIDCRSNNPCWASMTIASGLALAAISITVADPRLIQNTPSGDFCARRLRRLARVGSNMGTPDATQQRRPHYIERQCWPEQSGTAVGLIANALQSQSILPDKAKHDDKLAQTADAAADSDRGFH